MFSWGFALPLVALAVVGQALLFERLRHGFTKKSCLCFFFAKVNRYSLYGAAGSNALYILLDVQWHEVAFTVFEVKCSAALITAEKIAFPFSNAAKHLPTEMA